MRKISTQNLFISVYHLCRYKGHCQLTIKKFHGIATFILKDNRNDLSVFLKKKNIFLLYHLIKCDNLVECS